MIVGLAQTYIEWENKKVNFDKVKLCIEKFASICENIKQLGDDNIILFPEMSLTGFSMNIKATAEGNRETVAEIEKLSKEYHVSVGIGWVKQGNKFCENHYSIITPVDGEISDYAKIHPFSYAGEDDYFVGGTSVSLCSVGEFKVGTAICYDLRFPEVFQIISEEADFIVVPANWPKARKEHWITLLKARAIENQCFIAGINCCGRINGLEYSGDSCIFGPDGVMLAAECEENIVLYSNESINDGFDDIKNEKIMIYNISNNVADIRNAFPVKKDRRKKLYGEYFLNM